MVMVDVVNSDNEVVDQIKLSDEIFGLEPNPFIIQEVIRMQMANKRSGNASTKGRSEIHRTGAKFYRQKGTGRARRGSLRSPLVRGGGVTFGPKPRSYEYRPPRKVRKSALRMALSMKFAEKDLIVIDDFHVDKPETRKVLPRITKIVNNLPALIVVPSDKNNFVLSVRNSPLINTIPSEGLNVYSIVRNSKLVVFKECIASIEEALKP